MNDPRYPIGTFQRRDELTPDERRAWIDAIAGTPARLRDAVAGLDDAQLATPYRDGGWTVHQVVHHLADSHVNGYIRLKLALTEESPAIKPFDEARWAELSDVRDTPIETSLTLLDALHGRWSSLLRSLHDEDFRRTFVHPEHGKVTVDWLVAMYSWHGRHHVAQITSLRERSRW